MHKQPGMQPTPADLGVNCNGTHKGRAKPSLICKTCTATPQAQGPRSLMVHRLKAAHLPVCIRAC
jgi:hypothetical protein